MARKTRKYSKKNVEPRGPGEHSSPAVEIHNAFVARHTGGEPTAISYERARQQFQRLRGAVRLPATRPGDDALPDVEAYSDKDGEAP